MKLLLNVFVFLVFTSFCSSCAAPEGNKTNAQSLITSDSTSATFPFFKQPSEEDCGPACLYMIARHYKKQNSFEELRKLTKTTVEGTSLLAISDAAEKIGFTTIGVLTTYEKLLSDAPLPCIVHFQNHFAVLHRLEKNKVYVADPAFGLLELSKEEFLEKWGDENKEGIALLLELNNNSK